MKIEEWSVDRPIAYARNPRKNDGAVDAVAASIKEFGFKQPIVVDKDGVVVAGHTRLKAAIRESNGGPVRASVIREAEDWGSADLIARVRAVRSAPTAAS
jgi:ParB-like chromosome segregation protein Spo0J